MIKSYIVNLAIAIVVLSSVFTNVEAQDTGKVKLTFSEPDYTIGEDGTIQCLVEDDLLSMGVQGAKVVLFAQNNRQNIPLRLTKDDRALKAKLTNDNVIFELAAKDIFFTKRNKDGYYWKWQGRARAPLSPVVPVARKNIDSVKLWAVLHFNSYTYSSDTLTIQIQQ